MKNVNTRELRKMITNNEDLKILNVLPSESFKKLHLPNSISTPVSGGNFLASVEKNVTNKSDTLVLYCSGFECKASKEAATKLEDDGYTNVILYEGGIKEWQEKGLDFEGSDAMKFEKAS